MIYSGNSLESHIAFLYTSAAKAHLQISSPTENAPMNRKSGDHEERDEIEIGDFIFAFGGLEWDTGAGVRDLGGEGKALKRNGILKSLKKPFQKMKRKSDQEPLVSKISHSSTKNVINWATINTSDRQSGGVKTSTGSDTQLL
mmetsp:Transcript_3108/g.4809  ORF Transcript_3108/g.4809 Transcript_3108/m.4809 type:complete len:143 (+) Transcript_3108:3626-4054(+)